MVMERVDNRPIAMDKVAVEEIYIHGIIIIIILLLLLCSSKGSVELKTPSTDDCFVTYIFAFIPIQQPQRQHHLAKHLVVDFTQILQFITAFNYIGQPFH